MKKRRLSEITTLLSGYPFEASLFNDEKNGLPLIRVRDVNSGFAGFYYSGDYDPQYIINNGDTLISLDGDFKVVSWKNGRALLNQRVCKIISNEKVLNKEYLQHFLPEVLKELHRKTRFTTVKHLSTKTINNIEIPLPSLADQLHIARILSQAEQLIARRKESLRLLDGYLKSMFLEMFGDPVRNEKKWSVAELGNYAKVRIGPFGSLLHRKDYIKNGVPLVNPSHIVEGQISIDSNSTISKSKMRDLREFIMQEGDVVLGRRGEIGRCAVVTKKEDGYLCGTGSMYVRPKKGLNPVFLYNIFSSTSIRKALENSAKGITMKNLNSSIIENLEIPIPPIEPQTQFAGIVEKTEALKAQYRQSLQELEQLYGSLSQQAFRGELTQKKEKKKG